MNHKIEKLLLQGEFRAGAGAGGLWNLQLNWRSSISAVKYHSGKGNNLMDCMRY
jgi:hypothetical protein